MTPHITNIVRSATVLICALPITVSTATRLNVGTDVARQQLEVSPADQAVTDLKNDLTKACIDYKLGKLDGTVERKAKTALDEAFDGEVLYDRTCAFILG